MNDIKVKIDSIPFELNYNEYLTTELWGIISNRIKTRDNHQCRDRHKGITI